MTIPCKADDGWTCPLFKFCLARLNDPSIIGCGYALWYYGIIKSKSDIFVVHKARTEKQAESRNIPKRKKKKSEKEILRKDERTV